MRAKLLILGSMLVLGLLYQWMATVTVETYQNGFTLTSRIAQTAKIHLKRSDPSALLWCNGKKIAFIDPKKPDYFYHGEEEVNIPLRIGSTQCKTAKVFPLVKVKWSLFDFIVRFILWGIPLFVGVFYLFMFLLERIKRSVYANEAH